MRLYYCHYIDSKDVYLAHFSPTGRGPVITCNFDEVRFSTSREDMEETAKLYPRFEVCCLDAASVCISSAALDEQLRIPGVDDIDVILATTKFLSALDDLSKLCAVRFCDNGGTVSEFAGISYDDREGCIYIDLKYPRSKGSSGGITAMNLFGK